MANIYLGPHTHKYYTDIFALCINEAPLQGAAVAQQRHTTHNAFLYEFLQDWQP